MRKIKTTIAALLFGMFALNAQNASIPNVLNLRSAKSSGEIIQDNKLVGYYVFYMKEKVDKNNTTYEVELFDDNYNSTKSFEITRPKNTILLETVYNGSVFMLHFYDVKIGYEFVTFDRSGKMTGSNKVAKDNISKFDLSRIQANMTSGTENVTIHPNGTEGFVRSTYNKNKKMGYEIVGYDNNAKQIWSYASSETSENIEGADINDVSANILSATVTKKKNMMTREMTVYCLLLNSQTGKLIREIEMGNEVSGQRSLLKSFVNEKTGSIMLVGEFYKPKDDILKDKSQGLYMQELSLEGKDLNKKEYKWKGDIDKFKNALDPEDKKGDRPFYIFFHDVIVSENGHIFMIGEQFIKQVSAGGIAMGVLAGATGGSSNAAAFEILIANMVVIEFDEKRGMVDFKLVDKKRTKVILPQGMGMYGTALLGHYINSMGAFDYAYTSRDKGKDAFDVVYIDANRREEKGGAKSDVMVGVISIKGGKKTESRVPLNSEAKSFWIRPAKPGFISVSEYYRKEKRLDLRLEQLSY